MHTGRRYMHNEADVYYMITNEEIREEFTCIEFTCIMRQMCIT